MPVDSLIAICTIGDNIKETARLKGIFAEFSPELKQICRPGTFHPCTFLDSAGDTGQTARGSYARDLSLDWNE